MLSFGTLFNFWISYPRTHTKCSTMILTVLCNILAITSVRLLAVKDGAGRTSATNLAAGLPTLWKEFLIRPPRPLCMNRIPDVINFLSLQLKGTLGSMPPDQHTVYLMLTGEKPYVGRTTIQRQSSTYKLPGIARDGQNIYVVLTGI